MKSDAELFGLKGKRKLKAGETGNEFSDYSYEADTPETQNDSEKPPMDYNGNDNRSTSDTKPVGDPVVAKPTDAIVATVPKPKPTQTASVGHNGTTAGGLNREQYRDKWMSSGVKDMAGMKAWLAENGGTLDSDNGTVTTPFGEQIDMGGNARGSAAGNGQLTTAWTGVGGDGGGSGGDALAELIATNGAPGGSSIPGPNGAITNGLPNGLPNGVQTALDASLAGGIDADPATAAYRRSLTRDTDRARAQLAEQSAQDGTAGSGGTEGRIRQLGENRDEAIAGFAGGRAADVQKLQVAQDQFLKGLGFSYTQLDQQQKQFLANLGQNKEQFLASLGLSYAQLSAQQKADLDRLGYEYDRLEYEANRDATLTVLGR